MLGLLKDQQIDPQTLFTGQGYGPSELSPDEGVGAASLSRAEQLDLPDWLLPVFDASLGADADATAMALRHRAPVMLRANLLKGSRDAALKALAFEQIIAQAHPLASTAIEVTEGGRKVAGSATFQAGLVELQDVASQAVVETLVLGKGQRILDYCAGGGGKALALAALADSAVDAWDSDAARMKDIEKRAERAGADIACLTDAPRGQYDVVLCDVPCSGSGAWRRAPQGKWLLTADGLTQLGDVQSDILQQAARLVTPGGILVYTTCSVLAQENMGQLVKFIAATPEWDCDFSRQFLPSEGGDGFFVGHLRRV
jgi:16S rRNA (cytosine967-C5)-methyltransferase